MEITYDPAKNERNIRERGLSFERAREFDFATAIARPIFRKDEWRIEAFGYLENRLHVLCFKQMDTGIRVISYRKANEREAKKNGLEIRR